MVETQRASQVASCSESALGIQAGSWCIEDELGRRQPWLQRGDDFYLFYSGARYCEPGYAIGVARARSPLGPFEKRPSPLVHSSRGWLGPGHAAIVEGKRGEPYLAYHAYRASEGAPSCKAAGNKRRHVLLAPLDVTGAWPRVAGE